MIRKVFVGVNVKFDLEGNVTPTAITWEDGRIFEIDEILDQRRAASLKAGGIGLRYSIIINGKQTYLWYEYPKWFVEAKR